MMKKHVYLYFALFLVSILLIFMALNYKSIIIRVLSEPRSTIEAHMEKLEPYLTIKKHEGKNPVALLVTGCKHTYSYNTRWEDFYFSLGYSTVLLDSFTPRGIVDIEELKRTTCAGTELYGFDRAGDVQTILEYLKKQDWVDTDEILLVGWSHGAWSIMDAFAFSNRNKRIPNIKDTIHKPLDIVSKVVLFYPYCGFASQAHSNFTWDDTKGLLFLGRLDETTKAQQCIDWYEKQKDIPLELVVYEDADHVFDVFYDDAGNPEERFISAYFEDSKKRIRTLLY